MDSAWAGREESSRMVKNDFLLGTKTVTASSDNGAFSVQKSFFGSIIDLQPGWYLDTIPP